MTNLSLPPIQTMLSSQPFSNAMPLNLKKTHVPSPQNVFSHLSYPSPSSTTGALVYDSSPLETLAYRKLRRSGTARQTHSGMWSAVVESSQMLQDDQREINQALIGDQDKAPSSALDWYQSTGSLAGSQSAPSCFTSSDIEMASSVGSFSEDEDNFSVATNRDLTIDLGFVRAGAQSPPLVTLKAAQFTDSTSMAAPAFRSAYNSLESNASSLSLLSTTSVIQSCVPDPEEPLHYSSPSTETSLCASEGDGSGSDYEATVKFKRPVSKQKQVKTFKKKKATTSALELSSNVTPSEAPKRRRRSGQRKVGLDDTLERTFECGYCPMAFHRRHDMNVSLPLDDLEGMYSIAVFPSTAASKTSHRPEAL